MGRMETQTHDPFAKALIERMGGLTAAAKVFDIRPQSVNGWIDGGIPRYRLDYLKVARPELFDETLPPAPPRRAHGR